MSELVDASARVTDLGYTKTEKYLSVSNLSHTDSKCKKERYQQLNKTCWLLLININVHINFVKSMLIWVTVLLTSVDERPHDHTHSHSSLIVIYNSLFHSSPYGVHVLFVVTLESNQLFHFPLLVQLPALIFSIQFLNYNST